MDSSSEHDGRNEGCVVKGDARVPDSKDESPQMPVGQRHILTYPGLAVYQEVVVPMKPGQLLPNERIPFFALEYGRTEDFHFCELTKASGVQMWAHTGVECPHWGDAPIGRDQFEQVRAWMQTESMKVAASPNGDGLPFHVEVA